MKYNYDHHKDWLMNDSILSDAIGVIISKLTVNREFDVPYVAGYSEDGKTVYIDRHMPKSFKTKSGKTIDTDRFLIVHEAIEKTLMEKFGLMYQHAHQVALRVERDAVTSAGFDWDEYNDAMDEYIKSIGSEKLNKVAKNLDLEPYEDEADKKELKKFKAAMTESRSCQFCAIRKLLKEQS